MFRNQRTVTRGIVVLLTVYVGCSDQRSGLELSSANRAAATKVASLPPVATQPTSEAVSKAQIPTPAAAMPVERTPTNPVLKAGDGTIESAMAGLVDALARRDTDAFLQFVSEKRPFRYLVTVEKPYKTELVGYKELVRDLLSKERNGGWYVRLFDAGPDTAFSYFAEKSRGHSWKLVEENKFVPPDASADSAVFVTWRKFEGRWVVQSIGDPAV